MIPSFELSLRTRLIFGADKIDDLGALIKSLGSAVFMVSDPGILRAGHLDRARRALASHGIEVLTFTDVNENPTTLDVDRALDAWADFPATAIIGLGGGSSLDVAKAANLLRAGGGSIEDYWGRNKARGHLLPLIAVPTTAGTGSEAQSFALIARPTDHQKMACGDPKLAPTLALLDPTLTLSQPHHVTSCTGLDALGHAVETLVTKTRNPASHLFAHEAFRRIDRAFPRVLTDPTDLTARGEMLLAAAFAGCAIEHSMLGLAHSLANPLTAHRDIPHGLAVAIALPHVVRFNAADPQARALYADLARASSFCPHAAPDDSAVEHLAQRISELVTLARVSSRPASATAAEIDLLAREALGQWTAQFNPRPAELTDVVDLYGRIFQ